MELIERIEIWQDGCRFSYLHPTYGPFPDFAGVYEDVEGYRFLGCAWVDGDSWVVLVEGPKVNGPRIWTAGLLSTYRWRRTDDVTVVCGISGQDWCAGITDDVDDLKICEYVISASIDLYMTVQR